MGFHSDDRAVAPVIGFLLLFAMGFVGLSVYQAEYVPQQNSETEFEHSQLVVDDLTELSEAIADTTGADLPQRATVKLGTRYRTRIITLNPPPAAGTLETTDLQPVEISGSEIYQTRLIEYQTSYNEQRDLNYTIENGLVGDRGNDFILDSSTTITENTVVLTRVDREVSENGVQRAQVEFDPQEVDQFTANSPTEVTLPTYLGEETWNSELSGMEHEVVGFEDGTVNRVTIEFGPGTEIIHPTEETNVGQQQLEWESIDLGSTQHEYKWNGNYNDGDELKVDLTEIAPPPGRGDGGSAGFEYEPMLFTSSDDLSYSRANRELTITVNGDSMGGSFVVDTSDLEDGNPGQYDVTINDNGDSDTETVTID